MEHPNEEPFLTDKELRRIIRTSLPGSWESWMAKALLHDWEGMPNYDGAQCLQILEGPFIGNRARILAAESLRFAHLEPQQINRAEAILRKIVAKRDLPGWLFILICMGNMVWRFFLTFIGMLLLQLKMQTVSTPLYEALGVPILCFLLALPFLSFIYDGRRRFALRKKCAAALGRWGGPESIGVLLYAVEEGPHWNSVKSALRNVLMHLTHEDYGYVSAHTIGRLNKMLLKPYQPGELDEWIPLLLDSVEKVGNGSSVEAVEKIASKGRTPEWREQASRALQILLARQKLERDSSRLLRPITAEEGADALLRPAGMDSSANQHLLLHAVQDDFVV